MRLAMHKLPVKCKFVKKEDTIAEAAAAKEVV
jgi:ribosomal protein L16/L10AE